MLHVRRLSTFAKKCASLSPKPLKIGDALCVGTFAGTVMKEKHIRHSTWLRESTIDKVKVLFRTDHCRNQSEFIEKAILYYVGYLESERNTDYLSPTIMSSVRAASNANTTRITRILFKLAVETAVMNNLIAASIQFDPSEYNTLRRESERQVRRLNGDFSMTDALKWQRKLTDDDQSDS